MLAATLMEAAKNMLVIGLSVVRAFFSGLAELASAIISEMLGTRKIVLPVLSSLWYALTGRELTFMDLITLMLAVPATALYRAIEGSYPEPATDADAKSLLVGRRVMGLATGANLVFFGWFSAAMDAIRIVTGKNSKEVPLAGKNLSRVVVVLVNLELVGNVILQAIDRNRRTATDWAVTSLLVATAVRNVGAAFASSEYEKPICILGTILATGTIVALIFQAVESSKLEQADALEGLPSVIPLNNIVMQIPLLVNPLKLLGPTSGIVIVVPLIDVVCRTGAGVVFILYTARTWNDQVAAPAPSRHFLPQITSHQG